MSQQVTKLLYQLHCNRIFNLLSLSSFIDSYYCTLMLFQKCFIFKNIHREATEAVPHQDDGYAMIPAHVNLKQEAVLLLGPLDQASRDLSLPDRQGWCPYSALKQLQMTDHCPCASHKIMGVKSLSGEWDRRGAGHNLLKNDIAQGHDINWLEPARSKMVDKLSSTKPWASVYAHCNTSAH